ncbi:MAG: glycosyltransferase, partial [Myxococcota bacterium]
DYDSWRLSRAKMWLVKRLHRSALAHAVDRVVAVSDAVARHYEAQLQLSPATVIPNAVPYDALAGVAGDRARLAEVGLSPERLTVAAVGRLVHQKGHDRLLCALARLRDDGLDGQALIVGDGPERSALEALIERLQLEGYVALVPALPHPELMGLLASCDVFAMSSRFEGFGIALIEAMMLGLPPVVADISPLRELVEHGRYGRRVDASSAEALAAALGELFKTPEARRDLGERARTHAAERFSTQTVARQWHRLYQDLLET